MESDQRFVVVLTTVPADFDAEPLAARLVEVKLAACVNILPAMRSVYRWNEHRAVLKGRINELLGCRISEEKVYQRRAMEG